jgi:hypothetical protein
MGIAPTITVEAELASDSRTLFRLRVNGKVVGQSLTAVQAHVLVGDFLEQIVLPNQDRVWASHIAPNEINQDSNGSRRRELM